MRLQEGKEFAIFVSGFQNTKLTRFQERNPVVMIANHTEKALYIVPVPLDAASIGDATLCSPVVIKREGDSLVCSILPTPTTDLNKCCTTSSLQSTSFNEAIQRADWTISTVAAALRKYQIPVINSEADTYKLQLRPPIRHLSLPLLPNVLGSPPKSSPFSSPRRLYYTEPISTQHNLFDMEMV